MVYGNDLARAPFAPHSHAGAISAFGVTVRDVYDVFVSFVLLCLFLRFVCLCCVSCVLYEIAWICSFVLIHITKSF